MRAYYVPLGAGTLLAASAFLPRVRLGVGAAGALPAASALWTLALGFAAVLLAVLSLITRKNSRHPLFLVGLLALGIELLGWRFFERALSEQAWTTAQATAIVSGMPAATPEVATLAGGLYLGIAAAAVIILFGLTIVVKQAPRAYAEPEDDV